MTIEDFINEWDNLSIQRQKEGLKTLFKIISDDPLEYVGLVEAILNECLAEEAEDGFGTEGANI